MAISTYPNKAEEFNTRILVDILRVYGITIIFFNFNSSQDLIFHMLLCFNEIDVKLKMRKRKHLP